MNEEKFIEWIKQQKEIDLVEVELNSNDQNKETETCERIVMCDGDIFLKYLSNCDSSEIEKLESVGLL